MVRHSSTHSSCQDYFSSYLFLIYIDLFELFSRFEDDVLLIDGVIRVSQNPLTHAAFKTTPTVCGALIAPEEENQIIKVAHAVEQVMTTLPMVRPIHLFHAPSLLDACTSISSGSYSSSFANEAGSAIQADQSANSQSGWTLPVGPLSITWKQSIAPSSAAHTASGALSSSMNGRKGGGRGGAENEEAAQTTLCRLVESEAVVPHALTVRLNMVGQLSICRCAHFLFCWEALLRQFVTCIHRSAKCFMAPFNKYTALCRLRSLKCPSQLPGLNALFSPSLLCLCSSWPYRWTLFPRTSAATS